MQLCVPWHKVWHENWTQYYSRCNNTVFGISLKPTFSLFLCVKFQKISIQMYRSFGFPGMSQEGGHITLDPTLLFVILDCVLCLDGLSMCLNIMGHSLVLENFYLQIKKMELKFKKFIPGNFVFHCYLILYCNNTV